MARNATRGGGVSQGGVKTSRETFFRQLKSLAYKRWERVPSSITNSEPRIPKVFESDMELKEDAMAMDD